MLSYINLTDYIRGLSHTEDTLKNVMVYFI